jgi:serine protease inhibitor
MIVLQIDEKGTEAAAATAVVMTKCCAIMTPIEKPPIRFTADHSFLMFMVERKHNAVLFSSRVCDL